MHFCLGNPDSFHRGLAHSVFSSVVVGTLKEHVTRFQPEHKLADSDDPDGYTKDEERVVRLLNQRTDTTSF